MDFFSILAVGDLKNETWLTTGGAVERDLRLSVLRGMFVPFVLVPLLLYAAGDYETGKRLLAECFCNNITGETGNWASLKRFRRRWFCFSLRPDQSALSERLRVIQRLCSGMESLPWNERIQSLIAQIETLAIAPPASDYAHYYAAKGEDAGFADCAAWNEKQKNVALLLDRHNPASVLDIGSNVGWFSLLAAARGSRVMAMDADLSSVDILYRNIKYATRFPITPLWMTFDDLQTESFSLCADGIRQEHPFHMAATKRLRSDMIFCLGLLHHLTLGLGKTFHDVFAVLSALSAKVIVAEFIAMDDWAIAAQPDFFPSLAKWSCASYAMENAISAASRFGLRCTVLPSTPARTRHLLVFEP